MAYLFSHLRSKLLAGIFAAIPILVTIAIFYTLEQYTQAITKWFGLSIPGLGLAIAGLLIYLLGVLVTSLAGVFLLRLFDQLFSSLPGIRFVYQAWKDILLLPPNRSGMYHHVVLVHSSPAPIYEVGFTSSISFQGSNDWIPVLIPNVPNPLTARLLVVHRDRCSFPRVTVDEAFKYFFSTGNFLPPGLIVPAPKGDA